MIDTEQFSSFESLMMKAGSSDAVYCCVIYCPPGPAGLFLSDLNEFLSSVFKLGKVLFLGDFNLHIDVDTSNPAMGLLSVMEMFNFMQQISGPKHSLGVTLWT